MRAGEIVAERSTADVTEDEFFALMIGHDERADPPRGPRVPEPAPTRGRGLRAGHAFSRRLARPGPGHITTIVGTNGSGRESVCRAIFGAEPYDGGVLRVAGQEVRSGR